MNNEIYEQNVFWAFLSCFLYTVIYLVKTKTAVARNDYKPQCTYKNTDTEFFSTLKKNIAGGPYKVTMSRSIITLFVMLAISTVGTLSNPNYIFPDTYHIRLYRFHDKYNWNII